MPPLLASGPVVTVKSPLKVVRSAAPSESTVPSASKSRTRPVTTTSELPPKNSSVLPAIAVASTLTVSSLPAVLIDTLVLPVVTAISLSSALSAVFTRKAPDVISVASTLPAKSSTVIRAAPFKSSVMSLLSSAASTTTEPPVAAPVFTVVSAVPVFTTTFVALLSVVTSRVPESGSPAPSPSASTVTLLATLVTTKSAAPSTVNVSPNAIWSASTFTI